MIRCRFPRPSPLCRFPSSSPAPRPRSRAGPALPATPELSGGPALPLLPGSRWVRRLQPLRGNGRGTRGPSPYGYPYGLVAPVSVVRHTLQRKTWVWVVVLTAAVAALIGSVVGAEVGSKSQQTIVKQFFPNSSALTKPQDVQEILAKVEPAVVSINSRCPPVAGSAYGEVVEGAGTGMIITPPARSSPTTMWSPGPRP